MRLRVGAQNLQYHVIHLEKHATSPSRRPTGVASRKLNLDNSPVTGAGRGMHPTGVTTEFLSNSQIAELLALAAETAKMPLQKALRRASRKAFMWEEEAAVLMKNEGSLMKLPGIGTTLDRIIRQWIQNPSEVGLPPEIRRGFLSLPEARGILTKHSRLSVKGDLQMHTQWSDGSGSVEDMTCG